MLGKKMESTQAASITEVLEILDDRKKDGELGYEQQLAHEHAKKFAKLSKSEAEKMKKELLDEGLGEKTALKCVEIMPIDVLQLKLILVMEKKTLDEKGLGKVMGIIDSYRGK